MGGRWIAFDHDKGCCGAFESLRESALVLQILSFLDLEDLFKLRSVCKSWYDAVLSSSFVRIYNKFDPWVVLRVRTEAPPDRYQSMPAFQYDPDLHYGYFDYDMKLKAHVELWRPLRGESPKKCSVPLGPSGSWFAGLCSSNGLVCGRLMEERHTLTLAVGNPVTDEWKILPPPQVASKDILRPAFISIHMKRDPETTAYHIVFFYTEVSDEIELREPGDDDIAPIHGVQYDSEVGTWKKIPSLDSIRDSCGLPLRGYAYLHTFLGDTVVAFDPESRRWSHEDIHNPVRDEGFFFGLLDWVTYKGKCLWASIVYTPGFKEEYGAAVWELNHGKWELVSSIRWRDLFGSKWYMSFDSMKDLKVHISESVIVISSLYRKETYGHWPAVVYHMEKMMWYTSAEGEQFGTNERSMESCLLHDVECSYVIVPSLSAQP